MQIHQARELQVEEGDSEFSVKLHSVFVKQPEQPQVDRILGLGYLLSSAACRDSQVAVLGIRYCPVCAVLCLYRKQVSRGGRNTAV